MNFPKLLRTSLLLVFSLAPRCGHADPTPEDWATALLRELTKGDICGAAVLIARDGKILFQGGAGFADIAKKTPITPETKFRIGSVTKQFTAAAILRLAEEKKLALTDPLAKFFPDFPRGSEITLHHLLTHTSGIHSYTDKPDFLSRVHEAIEPGKLIASFQNDPPDFAPGASFHYNNSAYFLAGEIVAKVSGKSLGEYLRETFFEPLGMKDTGIYINATPPANAANGYSFIDGKLAPALDWDMSWAGGAGALYSTVGDLFRWNEALYGGRVLNEASLKAQIAPNKLPEGAEGMTYGYGLVISGVRRMPSIGHGGGLNGWSSELVRLPQQNCTIVALVNAMPSPPGLDATNIARGLAEHFLADEIKKLPPLTEDKSVDPKTFAAFVGRYDYRGSILTVIVENDRLFAQLTGQPKFEIYPKSANEFFWKVVDAQVVFLRNEKGEVTAAQHTQNGGTFKAPKLSAEDVKLTVEQLEAFVGQYQYGPAAVLTVTRDGAQLLAQLTGQPQFPIFPTSATNFEWRVVPAKVQFVKDDTGKVTKATHTQNGTTFDAPKIK
jgi:CubicO group peptidase (beta-lactamase class C family)